MPEVFVDKVADFADKNNVEIIVNGHFVDPMKDDG